MPKIYKRITDPGDPAAARHELGLLPDEKITAERLADAVSSQLTSKMNRTIGSLIYGEGLWDEAIALAVSDNDQVAFRASWGLEWAYMVDPTEIEIRFPAFFDASIRSQNGSVHRVYSKMICDTMRRGNLRLTDEQAERLAEKSFDLLINDNTATAVKAWQIEILADLTERLDWVEENLSAIVRTMSEAPDCSMGMAAQARHYFARMEKAKMKRKR